MVDCNADDILGTVSRIQDVHAWYSRLASAIGRRAVTGGGTPLSATLLQRYLRPGSTPLPFRWQAPAYLIDQACMRETLDHHRNVYLTHEQTRPAGRWGGVQPRYRRIQAQIGGAAFPFVMHYESLVDPPARWSVIGDDDQKDILYGLGTGWQLRTDVVATASAARNARDVYDVVFNSVLVTVKDRYDFDPRKHSDLPNPDVGSPSADAICPRRASITVYHTNALRMERAGLAEAYDHESYPWHTSFTPGRTSSQDRSWLPWAH